MANIGIWLSSGSDRFQFPVNPEEIPVSDSMGYEDVDIVNFGEVTMIGNSKLRGIEFSSFFPRDYNPAYCQYVAVPDPYGTATKLSKWMKEKKVLQLTITHTNISFPVTIRDFNYREKGGEPGDVYFDISFKEYKASTVRIYDPTKATTPGSGSTPSRPANVTYGKYTVKKGDTLWDISKKFYGDATQWKTIYYSNQKLIGPNPHKLVVGQVLQIKSPKYPDGTGVDPRVYPPQKRQTTVRTYNPNPTTVTKPKSTAPTNAEKQMLERVEKSTEEAFRVINAVGIFPSMFPW